MKGFSILIFFVLLFVTPSVFGQNNTQFKLLVGFELAHSQNDDDFDDSVAVYLDNEPDLPHPIKQITTTEWKLWGMKLKGLRETSLDDQTFKSNVKKVVGNYKGSEPTYTH